MHGQNPTDPHEIRRRTPLAPWAVLAAATSFVAAACSLGGPANTSSAGRDSTRLTGFTQTGTGATPAADHDRRTERRIARALARLTESGDAPVLADLAIANAAERTTVGIRLKQRMASGSVADVAPTEIAARLRRSVVVFARRYLCGSCDDWHTATASGFVVGDDLVVTCDHVLGERDDSTFAVMTADGAVAPVKGIVVRDGDSDLAVVRVGRIAGAERERAEVSDGPFADRILALRNEIQIGAPVHVMSHPRKAYFAYTAGVVSRRIEKRRGEVLEITAPFAKGSSGAPVVDSSGHVVAVVRATDSVYYTETDDEQRDLQMVFKRCTPAEAILRLLR